MKARCPNDPTHRRFVTTAHVLEEWVVDADGNHVEDRGALEVTVYPDPHNLWTCFECGEEAEFSDPPGIVTPGIGMDDPAVSV